MKHEFKVGDVVHFQNYTDRKIKAKVKAVSFGSFIGRPKRLEYHLTGVDKPLVSITSPKSIMESRFFSPVDVKDAFN